MERSINALELALRVLKALTERTAPNPDDVEELKGLAPLLADGPLDELACDVIQQALKRHTEIRARTARR